ncbi:MAG: hypothetical protein IPP61_00075 [Cytophagaceae bacterium]|nr:hypothetical protein [Cytophagaceae bacterium]MBL0323576.1 hypothetical protein [Cytophagaceae bacterium]
MEFYSHPIKTLYVGGQVKNKIPIDIEEQRTNYNDNYFLPFSEYDLLLGG